MEQILTLHEFAVPTLHYGGHDMACGVAVEDYQLKDFEDALIQIANDTLTPEDFIPKIQIDVFVQPEEVTEQLVEELEQLKPFGTDFETPNIAVTDFEVENCFVMGRTKEHLKLINKELSLIMWNGVKHYYENLGSAKYVQAIGTPSLNYWNGKTNVQMIVKDDNLRAYSFVNLQ